jgi:endonuclease YncB( thermonuclease family)
MALADKITGLLVAVAAGGLLWFAGKAYVSGDPPPENKVVADAPAPPAPAASPPRPPVPASPAAATAETPAPSDTPSGVPPSAPHPDTIRNVAPDDILPPPPVSGPLKRVEPRLPELPRREIPTEITFHQPMVIDAGSFRTKKLTIRLAGITAPRLEETCPSRLGGSWPCGVRARTALRALVRRHAITCDNMEETAGGLIRANCRRRDTDLATWMVEQGWARPGDGAPQAMTEAFEAARAARKGLWQLDWRTDRPPAGSAPAPGAATPDIAPLLGGEPVEIVDTPWYPGAEASEDGPVESPAGTNGDTHRPDTPEP